MIDVSILVLEKVKYALSSFRNDISGISFRAAQQTQNCLDACNQKIIECQAKIQELDDEIGELNAKIRFLDEQISLNYSKIKKVENKLQIMEQRIKNIATEIVRLQKELKVLQAELSKTEDSKKRQEIQVEIKYVNQQIQSLYQEQSDLEFQIQHMKEIGSQLRQKIDDLKNEKVKCEQALGIIKKRIYQYQDKYKRMKNLLNSILSYFDEYLVATRKFESSSETSTNKNTLAIDKCISQIEEYLLNITEWQGHSIR